jgi:pimeloyl-ACP methyl ester carboxylesterase
MPNASRAEFAEKDAAMNRASIDGIDFEYEDAGTGEPVVFIHGAFIADAFWPLLAEPALAGGYRLVLYRRRGYASSGYAGGPISVGQHAADCRELLHHLGVQRAHVVGHSYGGCVALQLALDDPEVAHSLALLEPGLAVGASAQNYRESLARGARRYVEGGAAVVVDEFFQARWPRYHETLEQVLPGAFARAVAAAETWFELELPGLLGWQFGETEARRITQPALAVLGGASDTLWARFGETQQLLLAWLPRAEGFVLHGATHFLHLESPSRRRAMAGALADFFARHPLSARPA